MLYQSIGVKFDLNSMYVTSYGKVEIRTSAPAGLSGTDHLAFGAGLYLLLLYMQRFGHMLIHE